MPKAYQRISLIAAIFVAASHAFGADPKYRDAGAHPVLEIVKVTVPKDTLKPIAFLFKLSARGNGRVAISQEQLALDILTRDAPLSRLFESDLKFSKDSPEIFVAIPAAPVTISATSSTNHDGDHKGWGAIKPGNYKLRVSIHSGKDRKFDYQWLGTTYSDEHELSIK